MRAPLTRAHPRSRGENLDQPGEWAYPTGSSPLTRGKPFAVVVALGGVGLIPAHAGKTDSCRLCAARVRAHPRSRGENHVLDVGGREDSGSSPLTRGKHMSRDRLWAGRGLIPAHAGKTIKRVLVDWTLAAHPRSRGENPLRRPCVMTCAGSSPLTRGKRFLTCTFIAQIGQILESLELCASFESYSLSDAYATDAPRDRVRSIGLAPPSSRAASSA